MKSAALIRLQRLLGMARTAEESRIVKATAKIAACRARAARLRQEIGEPCVDAASRSETPVAADMIAVSRWVLRLEEQAGTEDTRAAALEIEEAMIRECLARAFGRETVATAMLKKARIEERRLTERRAEAAIITPRLPFGNVLDQ